MKVKISKSKIIPNLFLIWIILFGLSKASWGILIPQRLWRLGLIAAGLTFFSGWLKNKPSVDTFSVSSVLVLMVICCFDNWNFDNPKTLQMCEVLYFALVGFSLFAYKYDRYYWMDFVSNLMFALGMIYALSTVFSALSSNFYYRLIYPIISSWYTTTHLGLGSYYSAGFTYHYSMNAMLIAVGVCVMSGKVFQGSAFTEKKRKWIYLYMVQFLALLLTEKRAHILFSLVSVLITYYVYTSDNPKRRRVKMLGIVAGGGIFGGIIYFIFPEVFRFVERFILALDAGDTTNGRLALWKVAYDMFLEHPLIGNGWYYFYFNIGLWENTHVHNIYLQLLTEVGIIGTIVFLFYMLSSYVKTIIVLKRSHAEEHGFIESDSQYLFASVMYQTFFLLYGITGTCLYEAQTLVPYIIFCTMGNWYWYQYRYEGLLE